MPVLSSFYGISVRLYFRDHEPPHFHARYAEREALVRIDDGRIVRGGLPPRARRLVEAWRSLHVEELQNRWQTAQAGQPMKPIEPLS